MIDHQMLVAGGRVVGLMIGGWGGGVPEHVTYPMMHFSGRSKASIPAHVPYAPNFLDFMQFLEILTKIVWWRHPEGW